MSEAEIGKACVDLWVLPTGVEARRSFCAEYIDILSPEEHVAVQAAVRPEVAGRLVSSRILLRLALARCLGCDTAQIRFGRLASGRLVLIEPATTGFHFSLSHSGMESVVATSAAGPIGVDIELARRADATLRIARSFYADAERERIEQSEAPARAALLHWTLKESVVKALGRTVWDGLGVFRFAIENSTVRMSAPSGEDPGRWRFALGSLGSDYVLAAALRLKRGSTHPVNFRLHTFGDGAADEANPFPARPSPSL